MLALSGDLGAAATGSGLAPFAHPRVCKGYETQFKECTGLSACIPCVPVDCAFAAWGEWTDAGGCTGVCFRDRSIGVPSNECGAPCRGLRQETKPCLPESCTRVPQDCAMADWTAWTDCGDDFTGQKARSRAIVQYPLHGGRECSGPTNETLPCGQRPAVDCALSEWDQWTECTATCGGGWHSQRRHVLRHARLGGQPCEGTMQRTEVCSARLCGERKDCELGAWSEWAGCGLLGGQQKHRSRQVVQAAAFGGRPCQGAVKETMGCPSGLTDQKPCMLSFWTDWASCSRTCDGGQAYRKRRIVSGPRNGGECKTESLHETRPCDAQPCIVPGANDCGLSDWAEWTACSAKCGVGVSQRERKVVIAAKLGGKGCNAGLRQTRACYADKEACGATDCLWADWEEWSACSFSCGGGTMHRDRIVKVAPRRGGVLCDPRDKSEIASCSTQSCEVCLDGAWEEWEDWSTCSASCDSGFRSRHRNVRLHPNDCGKPVVGLEDEYEPCSSGVPCVPDSDCALSDWSAWSACSSECYGVAERQRHVVHYATGNGRACHRVPAKEVVQCNPGRGEISPAGCSRPSPEACTLGQWSSWGECSASCNGGQKVRMRHVLSPAKHGGQPCEGELSMTAPCGGWPCLEECQDCLWSMWSDWGRCTACGNQRFRNRQVLRTANHCGKPCQAMHAREASSCQSACSKKHFCAWSEWSAFSPCSAECGPATKLRERAMVTFAEAPQSYLFEGPASSACSGAQMEMGWCELKACDSKEPVDCQFGAWAEWSAPTCTQLCERHRMISRLGRNGGRLCEGRMVETKRCERDCTHADDCVLSDWGEWGHCKERESQRYRSRSVRQYASNGGRECEEGNLEETASCSEPPPDVRPCTFGQWAPWSACSQSCGGGLQTRDRAVASPAESGGAMCEGELQQLRVCNAQQWCGGPVPCVMGSWAEWSSCFPGTDSTVISRSRDRRVLQEPRFGGAPCSTVVEELAPCPQASDCQLSQWTAWGACDKTCGGGQHARERKILQSPKGGGKQCPSSLVEVRGCSLAPCNRRDCVISDWAEWGPCTAPCGGGQQARGRHVVQLPMDGGTGCQMRLNETRECRDAQGALLARCPVVDCAWGVWSDWSSCSSRCEGGMRTRHRNITQPPQKGGKPCEAWDKEETEPCNTESCGHAACVNGHWDEWEEWETCSKSCNGGLTWRVRKILAEPNDCGTPAEGPSREYANCNAGTACAPDFDCMLSDWGLWGDCSKSCNGLKTRSRRIALPGRGRGRPCEGALNQTAPCAPSEGEALPAPCDSEFAADCKLSSWQAWESCSVSCGGGQATRSRVVVSEATGRGACPRRVLSETSSCNAQACPGECLPVDCEWGQWSAWGACDRCGGEKRRIRHVKSAARCGGRPCHERSSEEVTNCTRKCHEQSYCSFSVWGDWSTCSASCGNGVHKRERRLQITSESELKFWTDTQETALMSDFWQLQTEMEELQRHHVKTLVLSLACGVLSLLVGLMGIRTCSRDRLQPLEYDIEVMLE